MSIANFFINEHKPVIKRLFVANEDDYQLVQRCFPEPGFTTYIGGLAIRKLAEQLRQHDINSATDRLQHPDFASFTRALSSVHLADQADCGDERRGTGKAHLRTPRYQRVPTELAQAYQQIERDEKEKWRSEAS